MTGRRLLVYSVPSAVEIGVFSPGVDEFDQWDWSAARNPISYWVGFFFVGTTPIISRYFSLAWIIHVPICEARRVKLYEYNIPRT